MLDARVVVLMWTETLRRRVRRVRLVSTRLRTRLCVWTVLLDWLTWTLMLGHHATFAFPAHMHQEMERYVMHVLLVRLTWT